MDSETAQSRRQREFENFESMLHVSPCTYVCACVCSCVYVPFASTSMQLSDSSVVIFLIYIMLYNRHALYAVQFLSYLRSACLRLPLKPSSRGTVMNVKR